MIGCMIVVQRHFSYMANCVSQGPKGICYRGCEPEISPNPKAQNSEHPHGQVGHSNFVFVRARGPTYRSGSLHRTKYMSVRREYPHYAHIKEEQINKEGCSDAARELR